ncbi:hypothetical protein [Halobaculum litoreum]|uniref:Uncharacterized protein n=1 Tax=Halobaculum litoreum TaxID=3031998 RepID=A0ABD5XSW5_9EURY|nr:hypothetical protein [Halobaculum sp. DT92]
MIDARWRAEDMNMYCDPGTDRSVDGGPATGDAFDGTTAQDLRLPRPFPLPCPATPS